LPSTTRLAVAGLDRLLEAAVDGVVLEQIREVLRRGDVIQRNQLEFGLVEHGLEGRPADPAEAVDRHSLQPNPATASSTLNGFAPPTLNGFAPPPVRRSPADRTGAHRSVALAAAAPLTIHGSTRRRPCASDHREISLPKALQQCSILKVF
jgi:hypothetical protein